MSDARIDAALSSIRHDRTAFGYHDGTDRATLKRALAAADAVAASECEKPRGALVALVEANEQHHNAPPDWDRLDVALDAARALVGSAPQTQPEGDEARG